VAPTFPRRAGRRRRLRRFTRRDAVVLGVLLGIPILLDIAIVWGPTLASIGLSFTAWDGIGDIHWVGLDNYKNLADNYPPFWPAVRHNIMWLLFLGLIATPFGLFLAVLIDRGVRFSRFYQSVLYMPVVLSLAIVGFIAQLILGTDQGVINTILNNHDDPIDWLGNSHLNLWMIMIAAGCGIFAGYVGLLISYHAGVPSGPAVILVAGVLYVLSLLFGKVGGLARQMLPRRHLEA